MNVSFYTVYNLLKYLLFDWFHLCVWETSPLSYVWEYNLSSQWSHTQMNHITEHFTVIHKADEATTTSTIKHFTADEPKRKPLTLSRVGSVWYLPGQTKQSGTLPDDVQAAVIQTVCVCVTKCVGSHGCLALHGWVRLPPAAQPFFLQTVLHSVSYRASASRHIVISLPCRTETPNTQWKELEGTFLWLDYTQSWTKPFVDSEYKLRNILRAACHLYTVLWSDWIPILLYVFIHKMGNSSEVRK